MITICPSLTFSSPFTRCLCSLGNSLCSPPVSSDPNWVFLLRLRYPRWCAWCYPWGVEFCGFYGDFLHSCNWRKGSCVQRGSRGLVYCYGRCISTACYCFASNWTGQCKYTSFISLFISLCICIIVPNQSLQLSMEI